VFCPVHTAQDVSNERMHKVHHRKDCSLSKTAFLVCDLAYCAGSCTQRIPTVDRHRLCRKAYAYKSGCSFRGLLFMKPLAAVSPKPCVGRGLCRADVRSSRQSGRSNGSRVPGRLQADKAALLSNWCIVLDQGYLSGERSVGTVDKAASAPRPNHQHAHQGCEVRPLTYCTGHSIKYLISIMTGVECASSSRAHASITSCWGETNCTTPCYSLTRPRTRMLSKIMSAELLGSAFQIYNRVSRRPRYAMLASDRQTYTHTQ
jgi:hypothetical protein